MEEEEYLSLIRIPLPSSDIVRLCEKWKIKELYLFGSILRDDFNAESDVDILVTFIYDINWDLSKLYKMNNDFESIFEREVDIVDINSIKNPFLFDSIISPRTKSLTPEDRDPVYLWQMIYSARKIYERTLGLTKFQFYNNKNLQVVVELDLIIIAMMGEQISQNLQLAYTEIPWKELTILRRIVPYDYIPGLTIRTIDYIWQFLLEIPNFIFRLSAVMPPIPQTLEKWSSMCEMEKMLPKLEENDLSFGKCIVQSSQ